MLRTITYNNTAAVPNTTSRIITFVVDDGAAHSNTSALATTTLAINAPPTVTPPTLTDTLTTSNSIFNYTASSIVFADANGDTLTYTASLGNGAPLPTWLTFDANTRSFSGPMPGDFNGIIQLKITASDGTESVNATLNLTVTLNVSQGTARNDTLIGSGVIDSLDGDAGNDFLSGNAGADSLFGGADNDNLFGGPGADTVVGGGGNDTYSVDNSGDVIVDNSREGTDQVNSTITYTLGNNVENLGLLGTSDIHGTGNGLNNQILGNSGANSLIGDADNDTLIGGAGADSMIGGLGDDSYSVDSLNDVIIEAAGEGIDRVFTSLAIYLGRRSRRTHLSRDEWLHRDRQWVEQSPSWWQ